MSPAELPPEAQLAGPLWGILILALVIVVILGGILVVAIFGLHHMSL